MQRKDGKDDRSFEKLSCTSCKRLQGGGEIKRESGRMLGMRACKKPCIERERERKKEREKIEREHDPQALTPSLTP